ncbi:MAG: deoxyribodipyrimidine photo-lyase [Pseudomonadota bacterium]
MAEFDFPDAPIIVWFRDDLRIADNPALASAASSGQPVISLFVLETNDGHVPLGGAQRWWLHHALKALDGKLRAIGSRLIIKRGDSHEVVSSLVEETNAGSVVWNRRYSRYGIETDTKIKSQLKNDGIPAQSFAARLMHEPTQLKSGTGSAYKVYTPFWKTFRATIQPRAPVPAPTNIQTPDTWASSLSLEELDLLPTKPDWAGGLRDAWTPGEDGAFVRLERFLESGIDRYDSQRDLPAIEGTSGLSPHLAFGEISPFQIWARVDQVADDLPVDDVTTFRKELVWREFAYHLLVNFAELKTDNYNGQFDKFPWADSQEHLRAWQRGMTGYPIVDAGMRQLYETGWMHNRVRMIVGSFLVKHLLLDWRHGEEWFWDTLVDADPASNTASWQWVAGSGADAAPYFRIFNPMTQGEKFDSQGEYVKRWVPELAKMPAKLIHKPWEAPKNVLDYAGVTLGDTYPHPMVDHKQARERALNAYQNMRGMAA